MEKNEPVRKRRFWALPKWYQTQEGRDARKETLMEIHGRRFKVRVDGVLVAHCTTLTAARKLKALLEDVSGDFYERHKDTPAGQPGPAAAGAGDTGSADGPGNNAVDEIAAQPQGLEITSCEDGALSELAARGID